MSLLARRSPPSPCTGSSPVLQANAAQWHIVFLSAAAVFFVANALFLLFGTAEIQPWNSKGLVPVKDYETGEAPPTPPPPPPSEQPEKY